MKFLREIKIRQVEERLKDAWFDLGLRQLREGAVRFYRVKDFFTGEWLFKVCSDIKLGKTIIKAVKCPPGIYFVQLEGNTMLFQRSKMRGWVYGVISLSDVNGMDRIHRRSVKSLEEIPSMIRDNFKINSYMEATGKRTSGKYWVTLSKEGDEKRMITIFLLQRAWPLSPVSPKEKLKAIHALNMAGLKKEKIEIDTGYVCSCSICGLKFRLVHVNVDKKCKHKLITAENGSL